MNHLTLFLHSILIFFYFLLFIVAFTYSTNNLYSSLIVRIDFLYDNKENKLYFNEINNIPGSLSLYLFKGIIDVSVLLDKYILTGLRNYDTENSYINSYDDNIFENVNFNVNVKK